MSVSVCLCLSAIISWELHVRSSPNFCARYLWPWLAPSFSGGVAARYALPVLWMTSYLLISKKVARRRRPAEAQCTRSLGLGYKLCAKLGYNQLQANGRTRLLIGRLK